MKQPTKQSLREKNALLYRDICILIAKLPDGELKEEMGSKYTYWRLHLPPPAYLKKYIEKYGTESWVEAWLAIGSDETKIAEQ